MFDNKTVGYLFLRLSSSMNSFRMNKFLMFFNIVKIYQSTQAVLNLAVFQFSFSYTKMKKGSIALISQITTISKQRIYDPKVSSDILANLRVSDSTLNLIDAKIKELFLK